MTNEEIKIVFMIIVIAVSFWLGWLINAVLAAQKIERLIGKITYERQAKLNEREIVIDLRGRNVQQ